MRYACALTAALVVALPGCGGGPAPRSHPSPTVRAIERSIGERCKTHVVHSAFPGDRGHARLRALAQESLLIRCTGARHELAAYASFGSHARLLTALASIVLPPGRVEQFCVADRVAFTTDFWGSVAPVCRRARGRLRNIRRPPIPSAVSHRTYAPNCGTTYWLEFRRHRWSNGCMGGSDNVEQVTWRHWGERTARAVGTANLRGPCDPDCPRAAIYKARARIRLDHVRHCSDQGAVLRYFGRARVAVYMRPHNPFGYPTGWHHMSHKPMDGGCKLRHEDPLLHPTSG